jgi:hypothetical protein
METEYDLTRREARICALRAGRLRRLSASSVGPGAAQLLWGSAAPQSCHRVFRLSCGVSPYGLRDSPCAEPLTRLSGRLGRLEALPDPEGEDFDQVRSHAVGSDMDHIDAAPHQHTAADTPASDAEAPRQPLQCLFLDEGVEAVDAGSDASDHANADAGSIPAVSIID